MRKKLRDLGIGRNPNSRQNLGLRNLLLWQRFAILSFLLLLGKTSIFAQNPPPPVAGFSEAVPTFHCMGLYWEPMTFSSSKKVFVKYRKVGTQKWYNGYDMEPNRVMNVSGAYRLDRASYRGSVVNLTPDTDYEFQLTEEGSGGEVKTLTKRTMSETFPGSKVSTSVFNPENTLSNTLTISTSGTSSSYKIYDGKKSNGSNNLIDLNNTKSNGIYIDADYIIIRNFTIRETTENGIKINGTHHHIVIEDCDISKWGSKNAYSIANGKLFGVSDQAAIVNDNGTSNGSYLLGGHNFVVQRNKLHHPNYDTNNWDENNPQKKVGGNWEFEDHPNGPEPIFFRNVEGNIIIRYNEIYSDDTHYFNDGIAGGPDTGVNGSPAGPDSDIYGNFVSYCHDDAISSEGGNENVRIWNNYIQNTFVAFGNAAIRIGPTYWWRNVVGPGTEAPYGARGLYGVKMGSSGSLDYMTGKGYFFNNTFYHLGYNDGAGNLGGGRPVKHFTSRNNIIRTSSVYSASISSDDDGDNSFDYDLLNKTYPSSSVYELNGWPSSEPIYVSGSGFSGTAGSTALTGQFRITNESPGKDRAQIIPNFIDSWTANGPDVGAQEGQTDDMVFGITANFVPPVPNAYYDQLEAEDQTIVNGQVESSQSGYSGTGYVNSLNASGSYVEWEFDVEIGGTAKVTLRYANGSGSSRTASLTTNGGSAQNVTFANTGSWGSFTNLSNITVTLNEGTNKIRITTTGQDAGNLDYLQYEVLQTETLQAELADLVNTTADSSPYTGYDGSGYANIKNSSGSSVEWLVNKANVSTADITFRFSNGVVGSRNMNLTINGSQSQTVTFAGTGSFSTWTTVTISGKSLAAGVNKIKLTSTGDFGPRLDWMSFSSNASPSPTMTINQSDLLTVDLQDKDANAGFKVLAYPNPAKDLVKLSINHADGGALQIKFFSLDGREVKSLSVNGNGKFSTVEVPLIGLQIGVYVIQVNQNGNSAKTKLVIQ